MTLWGNWSRLITGRPNSQTLRSCFMRRVEVITIWWSDHQVGIYSLSQSTSAGLHGIV